MAAQLTVSADGGWRASSPLPDDVALQFDLYLPYCHCHPRGLVVAHVGQSLDGRIATESGDFRWVTGEADLLHCHRMRALADAVLVGARTVSADDPQLTVRRCAGSNPIRVVIDPELRLSGRHAVFRDGGAGTLIIAAQGHGASRSETHGSEIIGVPRVNGALDVLAIREALGHRGLSMVFIEGGGITISRFLEAGCLDRLQITIAPIITDKPPAWRSPVAERFTRRFARGSAASISVGTRCSIVISVHEAQAFWVVAPGRANRAQPVRALAPGELLIRSLVSAISRGTQSLVFRGEVPESEWRRMRCPFQEGEFPAPVKYGYAVVGVIEDGPGTQSAAACSACIRIRTDLLSRKMPSSPFPTMSPSAAPRSPPTWRRQSTGCGMAPRVRETGSPSSAPASSARCRRAGGADSRVQKSADRHGSHPRTRRDGAGLPFAIAAPKHTRPISSFMRAVDPRGSQRPLRPLASRRRCLK